MASRKTARSRKTKTPRARTRRRWSAEVTRHSDALDLESRVFAKTPPQIAASLMRSAQRSRRRKAGPYRSAMSMLTFYINRAGRGLSATRRAKLERAKAELRKLAPTASTPPRAGASRRSGDSRR
jgi:hypothetical protein